MRYLIVLFISFLLVGGCSSEKTNENYPSDNFSIESSEPIYEGPIPYEGQTVQKACGNVACSKYKECVNNECILKEGNYKFGLVYIYNLEDTHNPNWKKDIEIITGKFENALFDLTNGKFKVSIEVLGEVQTDIFCWNPAELGIKTKFSDSYSYMPLPGSGFCGIGIQPNAEFVEVNCDRCKFKEGEEEILEIDCDSPLSYDNLWNTNKLELLNEQIKNELNFNFSDYDEVFIILGRLGIPARDDPHFLEWACNGIYSYVGGYSNLIMAENAIIEPDNYFVDCRPLHPEWNEGIFGQSHYLKVGWQTMVHEILHKLDAVDIYETGTSFGIVSYRDEALKVDPLADNSIMGNSDKGCIEKGNHESDGIICTKEELEAVYLDKYNKRKIGLK